MAHAIPETMLDFDPASREDVVFKALKNGLGDDYWVFHSLKVNQTARNGAFYEKEADFVIFHRQKGILCIEAKNGRGISYYSGQWHYTGGREMEHRGPFKQAQLEGISVRNLLDRRAEETATLENDPRFLDIAKRCKVLWAVWFHGMDASAVDAINLPPEAPRDRILTMDDLAPEAVQAEIDRLFDTELPNGLETALSDEDFDWLIDKVLSPMIPCICPSAKSEANFKEIVYKQLIQEQARVLDFLDGQKSAVINGMAGTGKTFVAMERARRCAMRGEKTLYLCFNLALREYLENDFRHASPALAARVDFLTLDDFVSTLSKPLPSPEEFRRLGKEGSYKLQLDRYLSAAEKLMDQVGKFPYTQVVVDEGQDCAINFIQESGLMEILKDVVVAQANPLGFTSSFFMFYDAFQIVSLRIGTKAVLPKIISEADCKLTLYKNCRNTSSIASSAVRGILSTGKEPEMAAGTFAGDIPEIRFVGGTASPNELAAALTQTINEFRKTFRPEDIVILSCSPFGSGFSRFEKSFRTKPDGTVVFNQVYRVSTYRKFKGLDAAAVILVDVGKSSFAGDQGAMPFYEGASRARQKLAVISHMDDDDCAKVIEALRAKGCCGDDDSDAPPRSKLASALKMKSI